MEGSSPIASRPRVTPWGAATWVGAVIWVPAAALLPWLDAAVLLGPLVAAPLVLRLFSQPPLGPSHASPHRYWRWATLANLPAAALLLVSWALAPGWPAAVLAAPWLLVTLCLTR